METPTTSSAKDAFERLAAIAAQLLLQGRSVRSAAVKQALLRADPGFSERTLGFATFRDFVRGAEAAGFVRLVEAPAGPDVDVMPRDRPGGTTADGPTPVTPPRRRVRQDLWKAFTDWTLGLMRFWRPETGRAFAISANEMPGESPEVTSARAAFLADPAQCIPIDAIPRETVYQWMSEFAERAPEGVRTTVVASLQTATPFRGFTDAVREAGMAAAWYAEYTDLVVARIRTWARARNIEVDPFERSREPSVRADQRTERPQLANEQHVRAIAHQLVDRMSIAELLNLRVRLGDALDL